MGGSVVWDVCLRRHLKDYETSDFSKMIGFLDKVNLSFSKPNIRLWKIDAKGKFSIESFYIVLTNNSIGFED